MHYFKSEFRNLFLIFTLIFIVYLFTINQCLALVIDAANYAGETATNQLVFNPHHLLYHALFLFWNNILVQFGSTNVMFNLGMLNSLLGSLSVVMIYLILKVRFNLSASHSFFFSLLPAFSFGFWIVSVSTNVYTMSVLLLLCIFYFYLDENESKSKWIIIGVLHSTAILFNQWNVFIFLVILLSILLQKNKFREVRKFYLYYLIILIVMVGGVYLFIMVYIEHLYTIPDMMHWVTKYGGEFPWTTSLKRIILEALAGTSQTVIAPYWLFSVPFFSSIVTDFLPKTVSLTEEMYFGRLANPVLSSSLLILTLITGVVLVTVFIRIARDFYKTNKLLNNKLLYPLLWIIISSIMPLFWSGMFPKYWFIQTTVLFIVAFIVIDKNEKPKKSFYRALLYLLTCLVFFINFLGVMLPGTNKENDLTYQKTNEILNVYRSGDVVIFRNIWNLRFYFDIYSKNINSFIVTDKYDSLKINKALIYFKQIDRILQKNKLILTQEVVDEANTLYPLYQKYIYSLKSDSTLDMRLVNGKYLNYYIIKKK